MGLVGRTSRSEQPIKAAGTRERRKTAERIRDSRKRNRLLVRSPVIPQYHYALKGDVRFWAFYVMNAGETWLRELPHEEAIAPCRLASLHEDILHLFKEPLT